MGKGLQVVRAYVAPSQRELAARALRELRQALQALKRDGWVGMGAGWGLAKARSGGAEVVVNSLNVDRVLPACGLIDGKEAGLVLVGWSLTGALRAFCVDQLGNHAAEKYLAKVLPAEVSAFNSHPHTDEHDAVRALQKAIRLAAADCGIQLTERPARGAAAAPSPPRRVRSASR